MENHGRIKQGYIAININEGYDLWLFHLINHSIFYNSSLVTLHLTAKQLRQCRNVNYSSTVTFNIIIILFHSNSTEQVLLEKLTVTQLAFYESRNFITMFIRDRHLTLCNIS